MTLVDVPLDFPDDTYKLITREINNRGVVIEFSGYPLLEIISQVNPFPKGDTLVIEGADGYTFFISFDELHRNENLLLVKHGKGDTASFDIVGSESRKAWIRNIANLTIINSESLSIVGSSGEKSEFAPDEWKIDMDNTLVNFLGEVKKLQGVPIWKIVVRNLHFEKPNVITFKSINKSLAVNWCKIKDNGNLRIFPIIGRVGITYILAEMSGDVIIYPVTEIVIE
jgi:hypothetical protein